MLPLLYCLSLPFSSFLHPSQFCTSSACNPDLPVAVEIHPFIQYVLANLHRSEAPDMLEGLQSSPVVLQHQVHHDTGRGSEIFRVNFLFILNVCTGSYLLRPNTQLTKHFPLLERAASRSCATSMQCLQESL